MSFTDNNCLCFQHVQIISSFQHNHCIIILWWIVVGFYLRVNNIIKVSKWTERLICAPTQGAVNKSLRNHQNLVALKERKPGAFFKIRYRKLASLLWSREHRVLEICRLVDEDLKIDHERKSWGVRSGETWNSEGRVETTLWGRLSSSRAQITLNALPQWNMFHTANMLNMRIPAMDRTTRLRPLMCPLG